MSWIKKIIRLVRGVVHEELAQVHTHLPAQVVSYDATLNLVKIQPCINRFRVDDPSHRVDIQLPQIDDVPVHHFGSGKVLMSCAPVAGSYGTYHVSERSIAKWLNEGGINTPDQFRKFDISDGFFVPGLYTLKDDGDNGLIATGVNTDRIELRTRSGKSFVAVKNDDSVIISGGDISTPTTITIATDGDVTIAMASGKTFSVDGNFEVAST